MCPIDKLGHLLIAPHDPLVVDSLTTTTHGNVPCIPSQRSLLSLSLPRHWVCCLPCLPQMSTLRPRLLWALTSDPILGVHRGCSSCRNAHLAVSGWFIATLPPNVGKSLVPKHNIISSEVATFNIWIVTQAGSNQAVANQASNPLLLMLARIHSHTAWQLKSEHGWILRHTLLHEH